MIKAATLSMVAIAVSLSLIQFSSNAMADGALDFADPCKAEEKKFKSTASAIQTRAKESVSTVEAWNSDTSKIPSRVLNQYRALVKAAAYKAWEESPRGKGVIKSWKDQDPKVDVPTKFRQYIYETEMNEDLEVKFARLLFQRHYTESLKAQLQKDMEDVNKVLDEKRKELDSACSPAVFNQVFRSTIGRAVLIVNANFEAAKNEKGDVAGAIRALTGISPTDILSKGLAGGEGSEVNKLKRSLSDGLDNLGIGENHFLRESLRALDVTQIETPKSVQINIDGGTVENVCRNLTLGIGCR
ncbi:MAG: hypothetical protein KF751_10620 [Nitrospira sp.]|nr:hypothetical protein [Nitrospira sp.]